PFATTAASGPTAALRGTRCRWSASRPSPTISGARARGWRATTRRTSTASSSDRSALELVDVLLVLVVRAREHVLALVLGDEVEIVGSVGREHRFDRALAGVRDRAGRQAFVLVRVVDVVLIVELRAVQAIAAGAQVLLGARLV